MFDTINVQTRPCMACGKSTVLELDRGSFELYMKGLHVQDAFPEMDTAERELLITGTHGECWERMFGDEEE